MKTLIIIGAVAFVLTVVIVWISVSYLNKDAKEKGIEKDYTVWSVLSGAILAFFVIMYEIIKEVIFPSRHRTKK
jgi:RsiW-degrading membrane proteinase PrsW (M82 family)